MYSLGASDTRKDVGPSQSRERARQVCTANAEQSAKMLHLNVYVRSRIPLGEGVQGAAS